MKRVFIFVLILMMIIPVQAFGDVLPQELPKKEKALMVYSKLQQKLTTNG